MRQRIANQKGFIGLLVLIVVALIVLKFSYNFDVFNAANTPQGHETVGYVQQVFQTIWSYISVPVTLVWNNIIWPLAQLWWKTFQAFLSWSNSNISTPTH